MQWFQTPFVFDSHFIEFDLNGFLCITTQRSQDKDCVNTGGTYLFCDLPLTLHLVSFYALPYSRSENHLSLIQWPRKIMICLTGLANFMAVRYPSHLLSLEAHNEFLLFLNMNLIFYDDTTAHCSVPFVSTIFLPSFTAELCNGLDRISNQCRFRSSCYFSVIVTSATRNR